MMQRTKPILGRRAGPVSFTITLIPDLAGHVPLRIISASERLPE
ncbi:MAG: hypothetical protein AB9869_18050 [Verrucomicrobiia bacterium]